MYQSYLLYQAERPKTPREQLDEDIRAGQLAAAFAGLWRGLGQGLGRGLGRGLGLGRGRGLGRGPGRRPQSARPAEARLGFRCANANLD